MASPAEIVSTPWRQLIPMFDRGASQGGVYALGSFPEVSLDAHIVVSLIRQLGCARLMSGYFNDSRTGLRIVGTVSPQSLLRHQKLTLWHRHAEDSGGTGSRISAARSRCPAQSVLARRNHALA